MLGINRFPCASEFAKKPCGGGYISRMRRFCSGEASKVVHAASYLDLGVPSRAGAVWVSALQAPSLTASAADVVHAILCRRRKSKIAYAVIGWIVIFMVDHCRREMSVDVKPREAMRSVRVSCNLNVEMPVAIWETKGQRRITFWPSGGVTTKEEARVFVVMKHLLKLISGQFISANCHLLRSVSCAV